MRKWRVAQSLQKHWQRGSALDFALIREIQNTKMKKFISTLMMSLMVVAAGAFLTSTTNAQTRCNTNGRSSRVYRTDGNTVYGRNYETRYGNRVYTQGRYTGSNAYVKSPNVYQRHRQAFNLSIGTGAGALLGALIGGPRGALIGAGAGLGAGALVTHVQGPKNYYRYRR